MSRCFSKCRAKVNKAGPTVNCPDGHGSANDAASQPSSPLPSTCMPLFETSFSPLSDISPLPTSNPVSAASSALRRRALMDLYRCLQDLGASTLISLPHITIIGGQSAGKSSLVEVVSGINVPRDSSTCVKCPMECWLSSAAESWSCTVSLRYDYDEHNNLTGSKTVNFSPEFKEKSAVELWLRRAQLAIISPHVSPTKFLNKTAQECRDFLNGEADSRVPKFSKNTVIIDIKDPDTTDLSFIDLPGLIQNAPPDAIDLVENLVVSHIASDKTLILVTIPMPDDMENQQALKLAKNADSLGKRTIGVLTKPDLVLAGAISSQEVWKDVLDGRAHPLKHGYYCVRLPDDAGRTRNSTRARAQRIAAYFFDSTPPWCEIRDRRRLGVPGFVSDISKLLLQMVEDNLPVLMKEIEEKLTEAQVALGALPAPITREPSNEITLRVSKFCGDINNDVYGINHYRNDLVQESRRRYEHFKREIESTAPDFRPFVKPEDHPRLKYDDEEVSSSFIPTSEPLGLLDVRRVITDSIGWELHDHVPYQATKTLVTQFVVRWEEPSIGCFNDIFDLMSRKVDHLANVNFGQFKNLDNRVRCILREVISKTKAEALKSLKDVLQLEKNPLYTQNTHYLIAERKKWLSEYSKVYRDSSNTLASSSHVQQALASLTYAGFGKLTIEDLNCLPTDSFHRELKLMADVRAYFQVSYKRFIDYVPLMIELAMKQRLADRLQDALYSALFKEGNSVGMKDLLSEDPTIAAERELLKIKVARLRDAREKLAKFCRSYHS